MVLGHVYLGLGRFEESIAAFRRAFDLSDDLPVTLGWLGLTLGLSGQNAQARRVLEQLRDLGTKRYVLPSSIAWVHLGLGEIDDALAWMERAIERNDGWMPAMKSYTFLEPLKDDPRFRALIRKLNL
jgi:tetratricopeptide (TPR) repeat protein